jgi:hypothetical protein
MRGWGGNPDLREQAEALRGQLTLKRGDEYQMEKIDRLWPGWLAPGKLHVLGGQKGTGKSTIGFDTLAQLTSGSGTWPDGTPVLLQGDVLIWSGEDGIKDTILPRFAVAGGDRSRLVFIDGMTVDGVKRAFDPATDMPALLAAVQKLPNLLGILINPIVSATAGDSFKNAETRRGLQPLVDIAEKRNIAIIGITHFTKGSQGRDPIERITGSLAFGAIPRIVWGAVKGDSEDGARRLVRIASNIERTGGRFEYLLRQDLVPDHDFTAQRILWGEPLKGSPLELLERKDEKRKKEEAGKLLDTSSSTAPSPSPTLNMRLKPTASHGPRSSARRPRPNPSSKPSKQASCATSSCCRKTVPHAAGTGTASSLNRTDMTSDTGNSKWSTIQSVIQSSPGG